MENLLIKSFFQQILFLYYFFFLFSVYHWGVSMHYLSIVVDIQHTNDQWQRRKLRIVDIKMRHVHFLLHTFSSLILPLKHMSTLNNKSNNSNSQSYLITFFYCKNVILECSFQFCYIYDNFSKLAPILFVYEIDWNWVTNI